MKGLILMISIVVCRLGFLPKRLAGAAFFSQ
jgi:hypothetical protein